RTAWDLMVIPLSLSRSILSSTWDCISRLVSSPVISMIRSARVDLPWSIWAIIQKLRILLCSIAPTSIVPSIVSNVPVQHNIIACPGTLLQALRTPVCAVFYNKDLHTHGAVQPSCLGSLFHVRGILQYVPDLPPGKSFALVHAFSGHIGVKPRALGDLLSAKPLSHELLHLQQDPELPGQKSQYTKRRLLQRHQVIVVIQ